MSDFEKEFLKMLGYINLRLGEIRDALQDLNAEYDDDDQSEGS